jgi:hypothetical protein
LQPFEIKKTKNFPDYDAELKKRIAEAPKNPGGKETPKMGLNHVLRVVQHFLSRKPVALAHWYM